MVKKILLIINILMCSLLLLASFIGFIYSKQIWDINLGGRMIVINLLLGMPSYLYCIIRFFTKEKNNSGLFIMQSIAIGFISGIIGNLLLLLAQVLRGVT